jgi:hypothetical protein
MSVYECIEQYRQIGNFLFGHTRNPIPGGTRFSHTPMENEVPKIVKRFCKTHPAEEGPQKCNGQDKFAWIANSMARTDYPIDTDHHICQA